MFLRIPFALFVLAVASLPIFAQTTTTAALRGTVTLGDTDKPVHHVLITILQLKRSTDTDESGRYEFRDVPPGKYDVLAHLDRVPDVVHSVELGAGANATLDFKIELSGLREQVNVTATGSEQALSSSIQSVDVLGSVDLAKKSPVSLGEALDGELGIAKRSFDPAPRGL